MIPYSDCRVEQPYFDSYAGRWVIKITRSSGERFKMNYARYKMELHLGRYLDPSEDVHHVDENKTNDDINNLEVKDNVKHIREHNQKHFPMGFIICPECKEPFEMTAKKVCMMNVQKRKNSNYIGPFCSRQCACSFNGRTSRR